MRKLILILLLMVVSSLAVAEKVGISPVEKSPQETSRYGVVAEFIKELGETKDNQNIATEEEAQAAKIKNDVGKSQQTFINCIGNSERLRLHLNASNSMLKSMTLMSPFETLIPTLVKLNERKLMLYDEMSGICKVFMAGPKHDVDYATPAARMPEITSQLEFVDETIFKMTPLVFATLINDKPDSKNHLSHLIITKAEGKKLVDSINNYFGSSLDKKNQNWTVSSASVLRAYFKKNYKYSDEPWE